jgi:Zinc finger, ZZ type
MDGEPGLLGLRRALFTLWDGEGKPDSLAGVALGPAVVFLIDRTCGTLVQQLAADSVEEAIGRCRQMLDAEMADRLKFCSSRGHSGQGSDLACLPCRKSIFQRASRWLEEHPGWDIAASAVSPVFKNSWNALPNLSQELGNTAVHENVECDGCHTAPVVGPLSICSECPNFDLCRRCHANRAQVHPDHTFVTFDRPADAAALGLGSSTK